VCEASSAALTASASSKINTRTITLLASATAHTLPSGRVLVEVTLLGVDADSSVGGSSSSSRSTPCECECDDDDDASYQCVHDALPVLVPCMSQLVLTVGAKATAKNTDTHSQSSRRRSSSGGGGGGDGSAGGVTYTLFNPPTAGMTSQVPLVRTMAPAISTGRARVDSRFRARAHECDAAEYDLYVNGMPPASTEGAQAVETAGAAASNSAGAEEGFSQNIFLKTRSEGREIVAAGDGSGGSRAGSEVDDAANATSGNSMGNSGGGRCGGGADESSGEIGRPVVMVEPRMERMLARVLDEASTVQHASSCAEGVMIMQRIEQPAAATMRLQRKQSQTQPQTLAEARRQSRKASFSGRRVGGGYMPKPAEPKPMLGTRVGGEKSNSKSSSQVETEKKATVSVSEEGGEADASASALDADTRRPSAPSWGWAGTARTGSSNNRMPSSSGSGRNAL
jgi:hypothetical protein